MTQRIACVTLVVRDYGEALTFFAHGRVFLFLHTDDFWRDHRAMKSRGVTFIEEPRHEAYGTVVVSKICTQQMGPCTTANGLT